MKTCFDLLTTQVIPLFPLFLGSMSQFFFLAVGLQEMSWLVSRAWQRASLGDQDHVIP